MAREQQDYDDIPGTFVFDAERSRQGYGINMFCMSLMKDESRKAFKANEVEYLKKFKLTPEQTDAVLKRDDARRRPLGRGQPLPDRQKRAVQVLVGRTGDQESCCRKADSESQSEEDEIQISKTEVMPWPESLQV
jgi:hypothetical protein